MNLCPWDIRPRPHITENRNLHVIMMKFLLRDYSRNTIYTHALYQFFKELGLPFVEYKSAIVVDHCFANVGYSFAPNEKQRLWKFRGCQVVNFLMKNNAAMQFSDVTHMVSFMCISFMRRTPAGIYM
jgi:hypothetical protein